MQPAKKRKQNKTDSPETKISGGTAELVFDTFEHDFGKIDYGAKVSYVFKFKNTGTGVLVINSVKPTCSCTVTKFSKKPISPGGEGTLEVLFDSKGTNGYQSKTIEVMSNGFRKIMVLRISAEVK